MTSISNFGSGASFPLPSIPQFAMDTDHDVRNPQSKGFTLLEVMIAMAILATVIVSLLGLQNGSVKDVSKAERITMATLLAKRMMTETLIKKPLLPGEEEGEFSVEVYGDVYKDYRWKKAIAPTPIPQISEVRIAVLWKEGVRDELVELVSYE